MPWTTLFVSVVPYIVVPPLIAQAARRPRLRRSEAALAPVVGVLAEVPAMLSVVHVVNRSRAWHEAGMRPATDAGRSDSPLPVA